MATSRGWAYLEVHVTFPGINPPSDASVSIRFPEPEQAIWYHGYIVSKPFHSTNKLQSWRRNNAVTVRLPSRFTKITASVRCEGFYFTVSDKRLAEDWVANMLVWQLLPEYTVSPNQAQLGVVRNWSHSPTISTYLLACLPPEKNGQLQHDLPPPQIPEPPPPGQLYYAAAAAQNISGAVGSTGTAPRFELLPKEKPPPVPATDVREAAGSGFTPGGDGYRNQGQQELNQTPQALYNSAYRPNPHYPNMNPPYPNMNPHYPNMNPHYPNDNPHYPDIFSSYI